MRRLSVLALLAILASVILPAFASAETNSFYGEVVHVSVANVKVYDPRNHQTLSFILTPKFDQLFSADGKTTYQMKDLQHGQYVRVVYDQEVLGMRHADKIYILRNNNTKARKQIPSHIH